MKTALLIFTMLFSTTIYSQTPEDSVRLTITTLFEAMKSSNATLLKSVFADSAILQTITNDKITGQVKIRQDEVSSFVKQISGLPVNAANEKIVFDVVKVDGDLAIAWTPYQFFYNGAFSHCGVNSFQLVRLAGQWKIQYLIDTRRKQNCLP